MFLVDIGKMALAALILSGILHVLAGLSLLGVMACVPSRAWYLYVIGAVVSVAFWLFMAGFIGDLATPNQWHPEEGFTAAAMLRSLLDPNFFVLYGLPAMGWGFAYWFVGKREPSEPRRVGS